MATDFGTDISGTFDLDPAFALVSNNAALGQALVRRLITPRGALFYDPNYGFDVRMLQNSTLAPNELSAIAGMIEGECEKDDRVFTARCTLTRTGNAVRIALDIATALGPFALTLAVSAVGVEILRTI